MSGPLRLLSLVLGSLATGCSTPDPDLDIPGECVGVEDYFVSESCLEAIAAQCRALSTEAECSAAKPIEVDPVLYCAWTDVAVLADTETCEVESAFGRCEAALQTPADADPCGAGMFIEPGHVAFLAEQELVDGWVIGGGFSYYNGPVGPWYIRGEAADCASTDPPGPTWCSCAPEACAAAAE